MELVQPQYTKTEKAKLIILGTSINSQAGATKILEMLMKIEEIEDVSIDLEDWENVVRVETQKPLAIQKVMDCIKYSGFICYELPD